MMIRCRRVYVDGVIFRLFIIIFCMIAALLSEQINLDFIVLCMAILFFIITYRTFSSFILKYIGLLAPIGIGVLGTYIVENISLWLTELQKFSHHAGSYPLYVLYYLIFSLSLELFDRRNVYKGKNEAVIRISVNRIDMINKVLGFFGYIFYVVTFLMVIRLITHPFYLVHMDRFAYRQTYINGIWAKFAAYYTYFIPLLLMNWHQNKHKKLIVATFVLYILYLFIQGEKYGGYITVALYILMYLVPEIVKYHKEKLKKAFRAVIIVFVSSFALILIQYQIVFPSMKPMKRVYQRFAQQGQLWWSIYDRQQGRLPNRGEFSDELAAYSDDGSNPTPYYAIYKIMYLSAPRSVVTNKIATGSTYSDSTAASMYYYFGTPVLLLFAIVMGWFFSFLSFKYANYIRGKCIIEAIIVSRLIAMARGFFTMSYFTWLFDLETLITVIIWIVMIRIRKTKSYRATNMRLMSVSEGKG